MVAMEHSDLDDFIPPSATSGAARPLPVDTGTKAYPEPQPSTQRAAGDLEPLEQFVARERIYPEPWDRTQEEDIKGGAKRHRNPAANAHFTTSEETATGRALADWWVKIVDIWVKSDALPWDQRRVMELYFLTDHPCKGSGLFVGRDYRQYECPHCVEIDEKGEEHPFTVGVDQRGCLTEHNRQYGNQDVADEMGKGLTWVKERKREALAAIRLYMFPPKADVGPDGG